MLFWIMLVTKQLLVHSDFHSIITAADQMCAVARYNDISSKADRGEIFIVHDQKFIISHTPTLRCLFVP